MKKNQTARLIRRILLALFLLAFFGGGIRLLQLYRQYGNSRATQQQATEQYTDPAAPSPRPSPDAAERGTVCAPIRVDFDSLCAVNEDVIGWIYCEDTVINYPVVAGSDNEFYLNHDYRREYDPSGAIFTDMSNSRGFTDSNTILYGHHMSDLSMFATLKNWQDPDYLAEHPVMWLLTPERDYRVELFAAYPTTARSETYTIFRGPRPELEDYLAWVMRWSEVSTDVTLDIDSRYVVLSTCAYFYDDGRTVLHGKLVPVDSAGGVLLPAE